MFNFIALAISAPFIAYFSFSFLPLLWLSFYYILTFFLFIFLSPKKVYRTKDLKKRLIVLWIAFFKKKQQQMTSVLFSQWMELYCGGFGWWGIYQFWWFLTIVFVLFCFLLSFRFMATGVGGQQQKTKKNTLASATHTHSFSSSWITQLK